MRIKGPSSCLPSPATLARSLCVSAALVPLLLCASASAAPRGRRSAAPRAPAAAPAPAPSPAPTPPPAAPAAAPTPAPSPPPPAAPPPAPAATPAPGDLVPLLQQAHAACEAFELEACVSRTTAVVNRTDLDSDQQSRAYQDLAFAYSVIGQIAEAEQFFRLLLRLRPDMQLDESNTAPKIVVVFRKVQAEEQALARALAETERKRLVESIRADVSTVPRGRGGEPLVVTARVQDPRGGVARSVLRYRRGNQGEHSAEPFVAGPSGLSATLSAALTASEQPYNLEYFVELQDTSGQVLRRVGDAAQPLVVPVAAGTPSSPPFWKERRFWLVAGPVAGGGVALLAGVVLVAVAITVSGTVAAWLWSIQPPRGDQGTQRL